MKKDPNFRKNHKPKLIVWKWSWNANLKMKSLACFNTVDSHLKAKLTEFETQDCYPIANSKVFKIRIDAYSEK